ASMTAPNGRTTSAPATWSITLPRGQLRISQPGSSGASPSQLISVVNRSRQNRIDLLTSPCSRQGSDQLAYLLAPAGVERDLFPGVPPGGSAAQVTHQVDDAMQFVRLERQDPLVVAEREARDRVRPHVGIVPRHLAVLGQHRSTLAVLKQVPLIGPHERVDADVVL